MTEIYDGNSAESFDGSSSALMKGPKRVKKSPIEESNVTTTTTLKSSSSEEISKTTKEDKAKQAALSRAEQLKQYRMSKDTSTLKKSQPGIGKSLADSTSGTNAAAKRAIVPAQLAMGDALRSQPPARLAPKDSAKIKADEARARLQAEEEKQVCCTLHTYLNCCSIDEYKIHTKCMLKL